MSADVSALEPPQPVPGAALPLPDVPVCKSCLWYVVQRQDGTGEPTDHGQCHRYPPRPVVWPTGEVRSVCPTTHESYLCGEYEVRPPPTA
jgi:hypothetical protein